MDADRLRQIADVAADSEAEDGAAPIDDATWLALRTRPDDVAWWVSGDGFALVIGDDLSLVVRPASRGRGVGGSLAEQALASYDGTLRAWSHADHPGAARLAERHGFERVRELWVMRRSLADPPAAPRDRDDVAIRAFRPGDEAELLRVNAAAFAHHPEQGSMDSAELAERMAETWFDPADLFVAVDDQTMLGFHWTKRHSAALGEVYVVAIDPSAQGRGLGATLVARGLGHLHDVGIRDVLLYVESDNAPAVHLYEQLGFTHAPADTHVMYERPVQDLSEPGS